MLSYITDIVTRVSKGATHKSNKVFPADWLYNLTHRDSSRLAKEKIIVEIYTSVEVDSVTEIEYGIYNQVRSYAEEVFWVQKYFCC